MKNLLTNPAKYGIISGAVFSFGKFKGSEVRSVILDMRPMLRGETDRIRIGYELLPGLPDGVEPVGNADVTGEVTDSAGYMRLILTAQVRYRGVCARCLDPVEDVFSVTLERTACPEETLTQKQLEENVDEYAVIRGGLLDLDELIGEEILLSFPMRVLCSPDCPGLCPVCGKPRRLGACGCQTKEPDPRWAPLARLLQEKGTDGED